MKSAKAFSPSVQIEQTQVAVSLPIIQLNAMDVSILMVGDHDFLEAIVTRIHLLRDCVLDIATTPYQALQAIETKQPELLVCQVHRPDSFHLCQEIKSQSRWAWIYCLLLDENPYNPQESYAAQALESGADAYLWLTRSQHLEANDLTLLQQNRLIEAQIQVALRWIRNYRELVQTHDLLSEIALCDPLTELNNRRALEWELPRQIQNARDLGLPFSVLMLDVDYFKSVNDGYGHLAGDRILQLLAARLRHNLRGYDTAFRYGGEEFLILLNNTNPEEAFLIARRLCRLISERPFPINDDLELDITISAGTASLRADDDCQGTTLIDRADHNLLQAKSQGRNCAIGGDLELEFSGSKDSSSDIIVE